MKRNFFISKLLRFNKIVLLFWIIALVAQMSSCAKPLVVHDKTYSYLKLAEPDGIEDDASLSELLVAVERQIAYFERLIKSGKHNDKIAYLDTLKLFRQGLTTSKTNQDFVQFVRENFDFYKSEGKDGQVLFTGYYCPMLEGSLTQDNVYAYPIYETPEDLVVVSLKDFGIKDGGQIKGRIQDGKLTPYYTRKEIDEMKWFKAKPIVYVNDLVDVFFLHIQGSGFVRLTDGRMLPLQYANSNGHPYIGIGKLLIQDGKMTAQEASMQSIKAYFKAHPEDVKRYLYQNPSYVFFTVRNDDDPIGSLGVSLKDGRSIATDTELFPKGAIAYIETERPTLINGQTTLVKMKRFVIDQDTGGAIKGTARVDIFFGKGKEAEFSAGQMKYHGKLYYLLKKKRL